ncbi:MAG: tRNA (guanosine(46)-N7)-methyltransferase TrmB [Planctomycetia bacterium TMED53]|nr:MAG: tRNA (guanosine(46)-N7)-methyltransferase TrmB [Planctomycetia bacterium TMED53]
MTRLRRHRTLSAAQKARELHPQELIRVGGWERYFEAPGNLWLEIGTGKDTHIIERSRKFPESYHVGIEVTRKKFEMILRKADALLSEHGTTSDNLRFLNADAFQAVDACFAENSLAGAFILFPDPWPKKRHAGRRLLQKSFLQLVAGKLSPGAILEIRTDDPIYAVQARDALNEIPILNPLTDNGSWVHEPMNPEDHVETLFESKFRKRGLKIHHFYLSKVEE